MAGQGRPPTPAAQRRRRNVDPITRKTLTAAPPDPPALPGAEGYSAATCSWYRTWATSPQASRFLATDWQRLHMVALLVEKFYEAPTKELLSEIRLNEACLGATEADRLRLRWDVAPTKPAGAKRAATSTKRRAGILKVVGAQTA